MTNQKPTVKVAVETVYCLIHAKPKPCSTCILDEQFRNKWNERNELLRVFNQILLNEWKQAAEKQELRETPQLGDWKSLDVTYDTERFRKEINTGLQFARKTLKDYSDSWQGFDDLRQIVDIEIWKASVFRYKDKMNGAIAYTIAKNQGRRFLKNQIEEQTIPLENPDGSPVLDAFGKSMRIPRYFSFDHKGVDEEGKPRETNAIEDAIAMGRSGVDGGAPQRALKIADIQQVLSKLTKLVASWFGTKKTVGEHLLEDPESTVRNFPGVPKSTADRYRKTILEEFRKTINSSASTQN